MAFPCYFYPSFCARLSVSASALLVATVAAYATDFPVTSSTTSAVTLSPGDSLTVSSGGGVSTSGSTVSVTATGGSGSTTISNSGTISQTGTGRTIYSSSSGSGFNLQNLLGGIITSVGTDVMKMSNPVTVYTINNQGTIWQKGTGTASGQALDLRDITSTGNTITNGSSTNAAATIKADGDDAIRPGSNTTILNYGTIITNGVVNTKCPDYLGAACSGKPSAHDAIDVGGSTNFSADNYGTISGSRHGITADTELYVFNRAGGLIRGRNGSGVGSDGTGTVINYGTIRGEYAGAGNVYEHSSGVNSTANNGDGDGVDIDGVARIENYGTIIGAGAGGVDSSGNPNGADGIAAGGGVIINGVGALIQGGSNGILIDNGGGLAGVAATSITNAGTITGSNYGIRIAGAYNNTIINSGTISGGTFAIQTGAGADTLEIRGGSRIIGPVDLGGGADVIRFTGGNHKLTFSSGNLTSAILTSSSIPYIVSGDKVATIDPTSFAASAAMLQSTTRVISSLAPDFTPTLRDQKRPPIMSYAPAPEALKIPEGAMAYAADATLKSQTAVTADGSAIWTRVFGGQSHANAAGTLVGFRNSFFGGAIGVDMPVDASRRYGVFLGGVSNSSKLAENYGDTNSKMVFAGGYLRQSWGSSFMKLGLQAGLGSNDTSRNISNNTASGGVETAKGNYSNWYMSPELSVGHTYALGEFLKGDVSLTPVAQVRFLHGSFGGYGETGGTDNLRIGQRTSSSMEERLTLKASHVSSGLQGFDLKLELELGALANQRVGGGDVSATFVGQSVKFAQPGKGNRIGATAGVGAELTNGAVSFFVAGEYIARANSVLDYAGKMGLTVRF